MVEGPEAATVGGAADASPDGHDRMLVWAIQAGNRDALAQLYDRHAAQMLGVAVRILKNRRDAEDLIHDVFLEAWQKARSYDPTRGTVRTWLMMRVRSRGIDRIRATSTAQQYGVEAARSEAVCPPESADPSSAADHARARALLDRLSPGQRTVVELAYFGGLTCSEVADHCGIPVGTVKSRLSAAISKLRTELSAAAEART